MTKTNPYETMTWKEWWGLWGDHVDLPGVCRLKGRHGPTVLQDINKALEDGTAEFVDPVELARVLRDQPNVSIPPRVMEVICKSLDGTLRRYPKKPKVAVLNKAIQDEADPEGMLAAYRYSDFFDQIKERKNGSEGKRNDKDVPDHELAATMVAEEITKNTDKVITWERVRNMVHYYRKKNPHDSCAFSRHE